MLATHNFSFSHSVFYPFYEHSVIFTKFQILVCSLFQLGKSLNFVVWARVKPLPNDKILDLSKFKAYADAKTNVIEKLKFVLGRVENIVGKGEIAVNQYFLLFPTFFFKGLPFQGH